jgi:beta-lactamase regulating signal transducer with metallopeptidase domain
MTHFIATIVSAPVCAGLISSAVRALALAGLAAIGLWTFRVTDARLRLAVWKGVLYTALAMPLLGMLLPPLSIRMPQLLPARNTRSFTIETEGSPESVIASSTAAIEVSTAPSDGRSAKSRVKVPRSSQTTSTTIPASRHRGATIQWDLFAAVIYCSVALLLVVRFAIGIVFSRRLVRTAQRINESRLAPKFRARAHALGITAIPKIAESQVISVPVTVGALSPTILLPANWREWDDAKLDAVIAHELSHVARHDAFTQRASLVHCALFWFSPLAWWLDHHLADLAEQASDEAALLCGADRDDYARTLLGFFEAMHAAPGRVWWQGVSMANAGKAEQRLERILSWRGAVTMSLKKSVTVALIAFAVAVVYVAASARPASSGPQITPSAQAQTLPPAAASAPTPAPSQDSPSSAAAPVPALAPNAVPEMTPPAPASAPAPMAGPASAPADPAVWSGQSHGTGPSYGGYSYAYGFDDEQRFVIVTGKSDSLTMSGSIEDAHHAQRLRKQISGDFIWFERDEKSYIIRDQSTVDRARKLWAPQEELGKKQEELGKQQEALGRQQEALGRKMEQVRVNVPDMTAELDRLKAKLQKLGPTATMEQIGDLQSEIGELQSKMGEIQSQAGDQQGKLGEEQGALGEKQGKLGEQQGELGRQQAELAQKATIQMKSLLDEAIKNGKAQPEPEEGGGATL